MKLDLSTAGIISRMMQNIEFTKEEIEVALLYQTPTVKCIANDIRDVLCGRKAPTPTIQRQIDVLTAACKKGCIPMDIVVSKGIYGPLDLSNSEKDKELIGTEIELKGFLSTSLTKPFSRSHVYKISVPKGTNAIYLPPMLKDYNDPNNISLEEEDELLINRGYKVRIRDIERKDGLIIVYEDLIKPTIKLKLDLPPKQ